MFLLVPIKIQSWSVWKDSQNPMECTHISLLFKGKDIMQQENEHRHRGQRHLGTVPRVLTHRDRLYLQIEFPRRVQWILASGTLKAEVPTGVVFCPSGHVVQPGYLTRYTRWKPSVNKSWLGITRRDSDFKQHIINPTFHFLAKSQGQTFRHPLSCLSPAVT